MSSSSTARVSNQTDRRSTAEASRVSNGSKSERQDGRRPRSPQPASTNNAQHKRVPSGSQRTNRGVEERRTERVHVTTRETITTRARSPERRAPPPAVPSERSKPVDGDNLSDPRIKLRSDPLHGEMESVINIAGALC